MHECAQSSAGRATAAKHRGAAADAPRAPASARLRGARALGRRRTDKPRRVARRAGEEVPFPSERGPHPAIQLRRRSQGHHVRGLCRCMLCFARDRRRKVGPCVLGSAAAVRVGRPRVFLGARAQAAPTAAVLQAERARGGDGCVGEPRGPHGGSGRRERRPCRAAAGAPPHGRSATAPQRCSTVRAALTSAALRRGTLRRRQRRLRRPARPQTRRTRGSAPATSPPSRPRACPLAWTSRRRRFCGSLAPPRRSRRRTPSCTRSPPHAIPATRCERPAYVHVCCPAREARSTAPCRARRSWVSRSSCCGASAPWTARGPP